MTLKSNMLEEVIQAGASCEQEPASGSAIHGKTSFLFLARMASLPWL
jgi:hypothetical protein